MAAEKTKEKVKAEKPAKELKQKEEKKKSEKPVQKPIKEKSENKKEVKKIEKPKLTAEEKIKILEGMQLKPIVTEKAVMMVESQNILTFSEGMNKTKTDLKKIVEELFEVKVDKVRTMNKHNKKYAYVKLNKDNLAIDVATRLGLI